MINVYNQSLSRIGIVNTFVSNIWNEKYYGGGACQLVVSYNAAYSQLLSIGNFVGMSDKETLWQIRSTYRKDDELWVYGYTAEKALLNDRIANTIFTSSNVEADLRNLVSTYRPSGIVGLAAANGLTAVVVSQNTYKSLYDIATALCTSAGYGFKFIFDNAQGKLLFNVYDGQTRENAIFSERYGNLSDIYIQFSEMEYKNVAYIGGEGEGSERIYTTVGATSSIGLNRHEMFVDARDIRKEELTDAQYIALLQQRGIEKLNENNKYLDVSFDIEPTFFGRDFRLGDKIKCILPEEGITLASRVTEFTETRETNKKSLTISLGEYIIE